jgi:two-component system, NtrC family, sensor kinase
LEQLEYLLTVAQEPERAGGFKDTVQFSTVLEEATALHQSELDRLQIRIVRHYQPVHEGMLEVSKLLSILVNLLRTAINAMRDFPDRDHCLTLHVLPCPDRERFVRMQVEDTGIGIPKERLTQVLAPSLTLATPKPRPPNLHGCALTAKELGGALRVWSEGPGLGAMLTLDLPVIQMEEKRA